MNESLDELREARAGGGDTAVLKERLEAAEKHFEGKLNDVDAQLRDRAREWDKLLDAKSDEAARQQVMNILNELLNRRSYIRNLVVNVQKELL